jgi:phage gp36-like protein
MSYCAKADLITAVGEYELIQRTDRNRTGVIDDTVLNAALARADADINRYLRNKGFDVATPLVSNDLRYIAIDLTRFYLYEHSVPDEIQKAYDRQLKTLADFVEGKIALDIMQPDTTAQSAGDTAVLLPESLFGTQQLSGY